MKRNNRIRTLAGFMAIALMLSTFANDYNTITAHAENENPPTENAAGAASTEESVGDATSAPASTEEAAIEATSVAATEAPAAEATSAAATAATSEAATAASSTAAVPVAQTYTITYKVNDESFGTVSAKEEQYDSSNPNISGVDATAKDGYEFVNWTTDDGNGGQKEVGTDSHFKPENVTGDITYTANFETVTATTEEAPVTKTVKITYAAGDGGTVSRTEESLDVNSKDSKVEGSTATANDGYDFVNWTDASGAEVSTDPAFAPSKDSLTNDSYSYTAHFNKKAKEVKEITISYTAGEGGNVDPSSQKIDLNDEAAKVEGSTATADEGYDFVNWTNADGKEVSTDKTFAPAKGDLSADVTYTANFKKKVDEKNVTVTYKADEGGKVSADTETVDLNKEDAAFKGATATADDGYQFVKWTGAEDATVSEEATFVPAVKDVTADVTYTAVFEKKANNAVITYKSTNGGNVYPSTETVDLNDKDAVAKGSKATLVSKYFEFVNWTDEDGKEVSTDLTFVPEKVTGNATYTANFKNLVEMPVQNFSGSANGIDVFVHADEKTFPADTTMKVTEASVDKTVAEAAVDGDITSIYAVDITFYDKDGNKIEPANNNSVKVRMTLQNATLEGDNTVLHITDEGAEQAAKVTTGESGAGFEASSFSIYAIVGTDTTGGAVRKIFKFYDESSNLIEADTQIIKDQGIVNEPTIPDSTKAEFMGWYEKTNGVFNADKFNQFGKAIDVDQTLTNDVEVDLYARFKGTYYVYFHNTDGTLISDTKKGINGDIIDTTKGINLPSVPEGKVVTGWGTKGTDGSIIEANSVTINNSDVDLYPIIIDSVWLTFDSQGGTYEDSMYVTPKAPITKKLPTPTKTGYEFLGWYTSDDVEITSESTVDAAVTLFAHWEGQSVTYKIVRWFENADNTDYSLDDSANTITTKGSVITATGTAGSASTENENTLDKFNGFTLQKVENVTSINGDGTSVVNVYYNRKTYSIKFYAYSTDPAPYYTYDWRGNASLHIKWLSDPISDLTITAKYGAVISDKWPKSDSSNLYGTNWYVDKNADNAQASIKTMPLNGHDFYQVFQSGSKTYTINHYLEALSTDTDTITYNGKKYLSTPITETVIADGLVSTPEDHYDILGFIYSNNVNYNNHDEAEFLKDNWQGTKFHIDFYYNRAPFYVRFFSNKSEVTSLSFSKKYQEDVSGIDLTAKKYVLANQDGMVFGGWFANSECSGEPYKFSGTMPAHQISLYAKWTPITYTVTFDPNGATNTEDNKYADQIIAKNGKVSKPADPQKANSKFSNWYDQDGKVFDFSTLVGKDYQLIAHWFTEDSITVHYNANKDGVTIS